MRKPVSPEPAATIILVKEIDTGIETYITQRQQHLDFLGGFHVFPGGKLDRRDCTEDTLERCGDFLKDSSSFVVPGGHSPEVSISYYIAAIRELFEEAGVLLAYNRDGELVSGDDINIWQRLKGYRRRIHMREMHMTELMKSEDLTYALDQLVWLSRWVTPATSPRRFDTQFFLARLPHGQRPEPFEEEISDSSWLTPQEAIDRWRQGEIKIIPPTLASLDALVKYTDWDQIVIDLRNKAV